MTRIRVQTEISCGKCFRHEWVWAVIDLQDDVDRIPVDIIETKRIEYPEGWKKAKRYYESDYCPDCP